MEREELKMIVKTSYINMTVLIFLIRKLIYLHLIP
jgi:hypothetical protein